MSKSLKLREHIRTMPTRATHEKWKASRILTQKQCKAWRTSLDNSQPCLQILSFSCSNCLSTVKLNTQACTAILRANSIRRSWKLVIDWRNFSFYKKGLKLHQVGSNFLEIMKSAALDCQAHSMDWTTFLKHAALISSGAYHISCSRCPPFEHRDLRACWE